MNLCRHDQYILYDYDHSEPMWKLGLSSEFLEGGQPPWYLKTSDLENSKLREAAWTKFGHCSKIVKVCEAQFEKALKGTAALLLQFELARFTLFGSKFFRSRKVSLLGQPGSCLRLSILSSSLKPLQHASKLLSCRLSVGRKRNPQRRRNPQSTKLRGR